MQHVEVSTNRVEFGHPADGAVIVRPIRDSDERFWDEFVFAIGGGTFFHRAGWRHIFSDIFRLQPHYLVAERHGNLAGVLPLVHQRSRIFGNALIAAPFCVEGGPLATDAEARQALDQAALALMQETGADYVEFRSRKAVRPDWQCRRGLYANFSRPISDDDGRNLNAIPRKQRAVVRKALAGPLRSEVDNNPERLFRVYSESVRNLGTPMFPRSYFYALLETFGSDCDIVVILDDNHAVSAVMNFYFKDSVMPYYGGGTTAARRSGANDLLYWEVMR